MTPGTYKIPTSEDADKHLDASEQAAAIDLVEKHQALAVTSPDLLLNAQQEILKKLPALLKNLQSQLDNIVKTIDTTQKLEQRQVEIMADLDLATKVMAQLGHGDSAVQSKRSAERANNAATGTRQ